MEEVGIFLCIFRFFGKLKQSNGNYYVRTITIRIAHKKEHLGSPLFLLFCFTWLGCIFAGMASTASLIR